MATKKVLKYKDGTSIKVPVTEITQGSGITVTREVDQNNQETDKVTISAIHAEVVGTANQIDVNTTGTTSTVSIAEALVLPGKTVSFAQVYSGALPTDMIPNSLFFHDITVPNAQQQSSSLEYLISKNVNK